MPARPAQGQHSGKWQVPATLPAACAAGERTAIYVAISFLATPAMASVSLRHQLVAAHLPASMWDSGAVAPCRGLRYFTRLKPTLAISSRVRRHCLRRYQGAADSLNSTVLCVFGTGYERRTANPSKSGRVQVCDRVQSVRSRDAGKPLGKTERDPKADGTTSQKHFEKEIDPWMHGNIIRRSCWSGLGVLTGAC